MQVDREIAHCRETAARFDALAVDAAAIDPWAMVARRRETSRRLTRQRGG